MNFEIAPREPRIQINWYDARLYCFSLNIDGKTGWRLPTRNELGEIFQSPNDFSKVWHWSSTDNDSTSAWGQTFNNGFSVPVNKTDDYCIVRAIRDL